MYDSMTVPVLLEGILFSRPSNLFTTRSIVNLFRRVDWHYTTWYPSPKCTHEQSKLINNARGVGVSSESPEVLCRTINNPGKGMTALLLEKCGIISEQRIVRTLVRRSPPTGRR